MAEIQELKVGDVVQVHPGTGKFALCIMVVEDVRGWGALLTMEIPGPEPAEAPYRCAFEDMTRVGKVAWMRSLNSVPIRIVKGDDDA